MSRICLKNIAKRLLGLLPSSIRRWLRRRYYLRIVKRHQESGWEWTPFIKPLIPEGSLVIDIGANVGYLSGLFARWAGPAGRVISIEPIPATYDALSYSMKTLFPASVTTIQSCVSDREGEVTMAVPEYAGGGSNYYESRIIEANVSAANRFTVPATTLDQLLMNRNPDPVHNPDRFANPSVIKIDVEGHELAVIKGGSAFFSSCHPPLLIEVAGNPDEPDSQAAALFALLQNHGYSPKLIKDGQLKDRKPGDTSVDYLFT